MNGYTPTTPYKARIQNLLYNIPVTERPKAIADAWAAAKQEIENASKFDFERHLTGIVRATQVDPRTVEERFWDERADDWADTFKDAYDVTPFPKMPKIDLNKIDEIPF